VAAKRDPFLDGLRAVSVLRVISLHLMQRVEHPLLAVFSFLMPGMPLMFFVSGALAAASLGREGKDVRRRFWSERARRLLIPFWTFAAVVIATCAIGYAFVPDTRHAFDWTNLWRWVLPLAGPQASAAFDRLDWHLWFLSSLILMLAAAPLLLKVHQRVPFAGAAVFFAAGAGLELAQVGAPDVVRNTLLFGSAFLCGFGFADGRIQRWSRAVLFGAFVVLASFAVWFHHVRAPGTMLHAVLLALVVLGLGFVALWLVFRAPATRLFANTRVASFVKRINGRAYTLYLWGPIANEIAWACFTPRGALGYFANFALSLATLWLCVQIFGRAEDFAARRKPKPQPAPVAMPTAAVVEATPFAERRAA
jgi:peptidoglycan/LPS O-acetylase OafA/YrhL